MKTKIFILILISLFCHRVYGENLNIVSNAFTNRIISEQLTCDEKIELLKKVSLGKLSKKNFISILNYMSKKDFNDKLLDPLLDFLIKKTITGYKFNNTSLRKQIFPAIRKLIVRNVNNFKAIDKIIFILSNLENGTNSYDKNKDKFFFSIMKDNNKFFLYCIRSENDSFPYTSQKAITYALKEATQGKISKEDKLNIINIIEPYLNRINTREQLGYLIILTKANNSILSEKSKEYLKKITHTSNWSVLLKGKNKTQEIISEQALKVLLSPHVKKKEILRFASRQYRYFSSTVKKSDMKTINSLINFISNKKHSIFQRKINYNVLLTISQATNNKKSLNQLNKILVNEATFHELIFNSLGKDINDNFYKDKAISILKDSNSSLLNRSFAAYALRLINNNKKETAQYIFDNLKGCIKKRDDSRPGRVAAIALKQLLKKDYGTDLNAWQKAIDAMPDDK